MKKYRRPRGALILIDSRSYLMEHLTVYVYGEQSEKFRTSHRRFATSGNDRFKYINNHYLNHCPPSLVFRYLVNILNYSNALYFFQSILEYSYQKSIS